jgi:hypothetical protein
MSAKPAVSRRDKGLLLNVHADRTPTTLRSTVLPTVLKVPRCDRRKVESFSRQAV